MVWWADVRRDSHKVPQRSALVEDICDGVWPHRPLVRIGRDGPTYFSQQRAIVMAGATVNSLMARPRIRFADAATIFRRLAANAAATLSESDKGAFIRHSVELWEERDALAVDLRDPNIHRLLRTWVMVARAADSPGYDLDGRRFLSIANIHGVLAGDASTNEGYDLDASTAFTNTLVDRYLGRGILRRGLALKCGNCRNTSWYDAEDFGQTFQCHRCRVRSHIDASTRKGRGDAVWYYSLSEVVLQAITHNSRVPLLACDQLASDAKSDLWLPEQEVVLANGKQCESDIWMIIDGRIILGEAKVNGSLGSSPKKRAAEAKKYKELADLFSADAVVFASSTGWEDTSQAAIQDAFRFHRIVPQLISVDDPVQPRSKAVST
jgi:hypothetical protein